MNTVPIIIAILAAASCSAVLGTPAAPADNLNLVQEFQAFKLEYAKTYANDSREHAKRYANFQSSWRLIEEHNRRFAAGLESYELAINRFADQTLDEITGGCLLLEEDQQSLPDNADAAGGEQFEDTGDALNEPLPETVDWRTKGYVTPVKNEGQCGSCWAFAAIGALEAAQFKVSQRLVALSEQNLVDCSANNNGCRGGNAYRAFEYVQRNGGIDTAESYRYVAEAGQCRYRPQNVGAKVKKYAWVRPFGDEMALQRAVATVGPIAVSIEVTHKFGYFRGTGVFDDRTCSGRTLRHAVVVVGYGRQDGQDYWLVKNSWGAQWGDGGYIRMARNKGNQCGVARYPVYPVAEKV